MMEAVRTSETLVNFYQTTRHYNPEDSHLHVLLFSYFCIIRLIKIKMHEEVSLWFISQSFLVSRYEGRINIKIDVLENMLRKIFRSKKDDVIRYGNHNDKFHKCLSSSLIVRIVKLKEFIFAGYVACMVKTDSSTTSVCCLYMIL
jgi:hypothetical protein